MASILIVDDDEAVTQTFARMLRLEGFGPYGHNAESGLRKLENQPDAIILDLRMPLVDGLGFLDGCGPEGQRRTPVAIVTGDYFLDEQCRPSFASSAPSSSSSRSGSRTWSASPTLLKVTH